MGHEEGGVTGGGGGGGETAAASPPLPGGGGGGGGPTATPATSRPLKPRLGSGGLPPKERALVRLFAAACHRRWGDLGALAAAATTAGASPAELRATVRHLVVVGGYAHCLAATNALAAGGFLGPPTPGVIAGAAAPGRGGGGCGQATTSTTTALSPAAEGGGDGSAGGALPRPSPPASAFARVYCRAAPTVAGRLHAADPVLAEWIRLHLYGDVYASPGLPLATKQLLMVCFLGDAGMPDQLFGHAVAALREGATASGLLAALDAGFQASLEPASPTRAAAYDAALDALEHAWSRTRAEWEEHGEEGGGEGEEIPAWEGVASLPGVLDVGAWGVVEGAGQK